MPLSWNEIKTKALAFSKHVRLFGLIAGYKAQTIAPQDPGALIH